MRGFVGDLVTPACLCLTSLRISTSSTHVSSPLVYFSRRTYANQQMRKRAPQGQGRGQRQPNHRFSNSREQPQGGSVSSGSRFAEERGEYSEIDLNELKNNEEEIVQFMSSKSFSARAFAYKWFLRNLQMKGGSAEQRAKTLEKRLKLNGEVLRMFSEPQGEEQVSLLQKNRLQCGFVPKVIKDELERNDNRHQIEEKAFSLDDSQNEKNSENFNTPMSRHIARLRMLFQNIYNETPPTDSSTIDICKIVHTGISFGILRPNEISINDLMKETISIPWGVMPALRGGGRNYPLIERVFRVLDGMSIKCSVPLYIELLNPCESSTPRTVKKENSAESSLREISRRLPRGAMFVVPGSSLEIPATSLPCSEKTITGSEVPTNHVFDETTLTLSVTTNLRVVFTALGALMVMFGNGMRSSNGMILPKSNSNVNIHVMDSEIGTVSRKKVLRELKGSTEQNDESLFDNSSLKGLSPVLQKNLSGEKKMAEIAYEMYGNFISSAACIVIRLMALINTYDGIIKALAENPNDEVLKERLEYFINSVLLNEGFACGGAIRYIFPMIPSLIKATKTLADKVVSGAELTLLDRRELKRIYCFTNENDTSMVYDSTHENSIADISMVEMRDAVIQLLATVLPITCCTFFARFSKILLRFPSEICTANAFKTLAACEKMKNETASSDKVKDIGTLLMAELGKYTKQLRPAVVPSIETINSFKEINCVGVPSTPSMICFAIMSMLCDLRWQDCAAQERSQSEMFSVQNSVLLMLTELSEDILTGITGEFNQTSNTGESSSNAAGETAQTLSSSEQKTLQECQDTIYQIRSTSSSVLAMIFKCRAYISNTENCRRLDDAQTFKKSGLPQRAAPHTLRNTLSVLCENSIRCMIHSDTYILGVKAHLNNVTPSFSTLMTLTHLQRLLHTLSVSLSGTEHNSSAFIDAAEVARAVQQVRPRLFECLSTITPTFLQRSCEAPVNSLAAAQISNLTASGLSPVNVKNKSSKDKGEDAEGEEGAGDTSSAAPDEVNTADVQNYKLGSQVNLQMRRLTGVASDINKIMVSLFRLQRYIQNHISTAQSTSCQLVSNVTPDVIRLLLNSYLVACEAVDRAAISKGRVSAYDNASGTSIENELKTIFPNPLRLNGKSTLSTITNLILRCSGEILLRMGSTEWAMNDKEISVSARVMKMATRQQLYEMLAIFGYTRTILASMNENDWDARKPLFIRSPFLTFIRKLIKENSTEAFFKARDDRTDGTVLEIGTSKVTESALMLADLIVLVGTRCCQLDTLQVVLANRCIALKETCANSAGESAQNKETMPNMCNYMITMIVNDEFELMFDAAKNTSCSEEIVLEAMKRLPSKSLQQFTSAGDSIFKNNFEDTILGRFYHEACVDVNPTSREDFSLGSEGMDVGSKISQLISVVEQNISEIKTDRATNTSQISATNLKGSVVRLLARSLPELIVSCSIGFGAHGPKGEQLLGTGEAVNALHTINQALSLKELHDFLIQDNKYNSDDFAYSVATGIIAFLHSVPLQSVGSSVALVHLRQWNLLVVALRRYVKLKRKTTQNDYGKLTRASKVVIATLIACITQTAFCEIFSFIVTGSSLKSSDQNNLYSDIEASQSLYLHSHSHLYGKGINAGFFFIHNHLTFLSMIRDLNFSHSLSSIPKYLAAESVGVIDVFCVQRALPYILKNMSNVSVSDRDNLASGVSSVLSALDSGLQRSATDGTSAADVTITRRNPFYYYDRYLHCYARVYKCLRVFFDNILIDKHSGQVDLLLMDVTERGRSGIREICQSLWIITEAMNRSHAGAASYGANLLVDIKNSGEEELLQTLRGAVRVVSALASLKLTFKHLDAVNVTRGLNSLVVSDTDEASFAGETVKEENLLGKSMFAICDFIVNILYEIQFCLHVTINSSVKFRNCLVANVVMPLLLSLSSVQLRHLGVLYALLPHLPSLVETGGSSIISVEADTVTSKDGDISLDAESDAEIMELLDDSNTTTDPVVSLNNERPLTLSFTNVCSIIRAYATLSVWNSSALGGLLQALTNQLSIRNSTEELRSKVIQDLMNASQLLFDLSHFKGISVLNLDTNTSIRCAGHAYTTNEPQFVNEACLDDFDDDYIIGDLGGVSKGGSEAVPSVTSIFEVLTRYIYETAYSPSTNLSIDTNVLTRLSTQTLAALAAMEIPPTDLFDAVVTHLWQNIAEWAIGALLNKSSSTEPHPNQFSGSSLSARTFFSFNSPVISLQTILLVLSSATRCSVEKQAELESMNTKILARHESTNKSFSVINVGTHPFTVILCALLKNHKEETSLIFSNLWQFTTLLRCVQLSISADSSPELCLRLFTAVNAVINQYLEAVERGTAISSSDSLGGAYVQPESFAALLIEMVTTLNLLRDLSSRVYSQVHSAICTLLVRFTVVYSPKLFMTGQCMSVGEDTPMEPQRMISDPVTVNIFWGAVGEEGTARRVWSTPALAQLAIALTGLCREAKDHVSAISGLAESVLMTIAHRARNLRSSMDDVTRQQDAAEVALPDTAAAWLYLRGALEVLRMHALECPKRGAVQEGDDAANVEAMCFSITRRPQLLSPAGALMVLEAVAAAEFAAAQQLANQNARVSTSTDLCGHTFEAAKNTTEETAESTSESPVVAPPSQTFSLTYMFIRAITAAARRIISARTKPIELRFYADSGSGDGVRQNSDVSFNVAVASKEMMPVVSAAAAAKDEIARKQVFSGSLTSKFRSIQLKNNFPFLYKQTMNNTDAEDVDVQQRAGVPKELQVLLKERLALWFS